MRIFASAIFILFCWLVIAPRLVFASVVINEIFFDPSGSDTGLERIELYNPEASAADLSGWELYPDGIGYFIFPSGFSIASRSFAVVHLRSSGANPAESGTANLYHDAANGNMGNSSGSVALFRPGGRSKDTIADFVRYHKLGAGERKTWEPAAVEAGLWTAGTFVDISSLGEGNSISLAADGVRQNSASWRIYETPSVGGANAAVTGGSATSGNSSVFAATSTSSGAPLNSSGPAPTPALGAEAGPDAKALAGAIVTFRGAAFGLNGQALDNARFLWNFGDGSLQEGKALTHIYHFPGDYRVNLSVASGEYAGSDWLTVAVMPPKLKLSEVKPGDDGFVEIFNGSDADADLAGINITDEGGRVFRLPPRTIAEAGNAIVLPSVITVLRPINKVILRDARGAIIDTAEFNGVPPAGASWERFGEKFVIQPRPTPGVFVLESQGGDTTAADAIAIKYAGIRPLSTANASREVKISKDVSKIAPATGYSAEENPVSIAAEKNYPSAGSDQKSETRALAGIFSARVFLVAGLALAVFAAFGVLILKRMMSRGGSK